MLNQEQEQVRAQTVRDLYEKKLLTKRNVSVASLKLKLDLKVLAQEFGYDDVREFFHEFVDTMPEHEDLTQTFEPWTAVDMIQASWLRHVENKSFGDIAKILGKTTKSVSSFFRRTFKMGNTVNRSVYELVKENQDLKTLAEVSGQPLWRIEFARNLVLLDLEALRYPSKLPRPVIRLED